MAAPLGNGKKVPQMFSIYSPKCKTIEKNNKKKHTQSKLFAMPFNVPIAKRQS